MRIISKSEYDGTRQELQTLINTYLSELENHKFTVGVPAPLPPFELIDELSKNSEFVLENEKGWAWKKACETCDMQPVNVRSAYEHETEIDETWTNEDPTGKIWDGISLRDYTPEELLAQSRIMMNVSARQARLALHSAGLLDAVEQAVAQAGGTVEIEWKFASTIERTSPLVQSLSSQLGLTDIQLDELFTLAATL